MQPKAEVPETLIDQSLPRRWVLGPGEVRVERENRAPVIFGHKSAEMLKIALRYGGSKERAWTWQEVVDAIWWEDYRRQNPGASRGRDGTKCRESKQANYLTLRKRIEERLEQEGIPGDSLYVADGRLYCRLREEDRVENQENWEED